MREISIITPALSSKVNTSGNNLEVHSSTPPDGVLLGINSIPTVDESDQTLPQLDQTSEISIETP